MEDVIEFSYKGKQYSGHVLSSLDMTPHYHWLIFKQPELREVLGEEIAFVVKDLREAVQGKEILTPVNSPSPGLKVAMIVHDGTPIELMEFEEGA